MKVSMTIVSVLGSCAAVAGCDVDETPNPTQKVPNVDPVAHSVGESVDRNAVNQEMAERQEERVEDAEEAADDAKEADELVREATNTLNEMKSNAKLLSLLKAAKGVFVVPDYGRGAVGVGVRGGEGILLLHHGGDGGWSAPIFYDLGGISLGAQLGGEGGDIAMLLMSDEAVDTFQRDASFTINADAKLTLVDYSALSEAALGEDQDIVFWSGTEGAFAGVALGVTDIDWDDDENPAYHGAKVTKKDLFAVKGDYRPKGALEQALTGL